MPEKEYFGQNLAVLGPKFLIFTGGSKSFGTHITEKPPRHLVHIVCWSAMRPDGQKCQYLAKKCKFGRLGQTILMFTGVSKSFVA